MTWGDFKKAVEAAGAEDKMPIAWIDVGPGSAIDVEVRLPTPDTNEGLEIT